MTPDDIKSRAQIEDEDDIENKDIAIGDRDRLEPDMPLDCLSQPSQDDLYLTERRLLKGDINVQLKHKDIASAVTLPDLVTVEPKEHIV